MKKILLPIKPEHVVNILNGKKTVEIRKYIPKCKLPCEVYIYCSEGKRHHYLCKLYKDNKYLNYNYESHKGYGCMPNPLNGKVVAKFILNTTEYCDDTSCLNDEEYDLEPTCLTAKEIQNYSKEIYVWHIDNLEIFDEPISLYEHKIGNPKTGIAITKAPQKYCYCEYDENGFLPF